MLGGSGLPAVLLLWGLLATVFAPVAFSNRALFSRHPRLGLISWFTALLSGMLSTLAAIEIGFFYVLENWLRLSVTTVNKANFAIVILQSLAPWIFIATISSLVVVAYLRVEPMRELAIEVKHQLNQGLKVDFKFEGVDTSIIRIGAPIAFVTKVSGKNRIVVSNETKALLTAEELDAVLWHEIGHIWGSHNLLKRTAYLITALFSWIPTTKTFVSNVEWLCELEADYFALQQVTSESLVSAKLKFLF